MLEFKNFNLKISCFTKKYVSYYILGYSAYSKEEHQNFIMSRIQTGISLCALVDQLNQTLQGLVSVMFISCASESILSIYCASSVAIFNNNHVTLPVWLMFKMKPK